MSAVKRLSGTDDVRALAVHLNRQERTRPVVVISVPAATIEPYIDSVEVADQLGDLAEVYLIGPGDDSWAFTDNMPDPTQVFGGGGRVYPVGTEWVTNPVPLTTSVRLRRLARPGGREAARLLVFDALRMASDPMCGEPVTALPHLWATAFRGTPVSEPRCRWRTRRCSHARRRAPIRGSGRPACPVP